MFLIFIVSPLVRYWAPRPGVEPGLHGPRPRVLPLHQQGTTRQREEPSTLARSRRGEDSRGIGPGDAPSDRLSARRCRHEGRSTPVEVAGIEPATFSMPSRRATNCAIPPEVPGTYVPRLPDIASGPSE